MPKGKKQQDQKELREAVVETTSEPVKPREQVQEVIKDPSAKEEARILALMKFPFIYIGDEFEVAEVGKIKVMDMAYQKTVKIAGPTGADGKPRFEEKKLRVRCNNTSEAEPDYLPSVIITYKIPGAFRQADQQKALTLEEFYRFVPKIEEPI